MDNVEWNDNKTEKEDKTETIKSARPILAKKVTDYIRLELLKHQKDLQSQENGNTIQLEKFVKTYNDLKDSVTKIPYGDSERKEEREEALRKINAYEYKYKGNGIDDKGDSIVLSEQDINELIKLIQESIETLGFSGSASFSNATVFMQSTLLDLVNSIDGKSDLPSNLEKREEANKYITYLKSNGSFIPTGLSSSEQNLIYSYGYGNAFQISSPEKVLFRMEKDGTISIEEAIEEKTPLQQREAELSSLEAKKEKMIEIDELQSKLSQKEGQDIGE